MRSPDPLSLQGQPVADWLADVAARAPEKIALRGDAGDISYADMAGRIDAVAAVLAQAGIGPGDHVAWLGLNSPAMLDTLFACARLGAVFMPLNWRLAPPEHADMMRRCPPGLFIADPEFIPACVDGQVVPPGIVSLSHGASTAGWPTWTDWLHQAAGAPLPDQDTAPDDILLLCFTSGSTGRPKGVQLSQAALTANADASVALHAMTADDRVLTTLPLFHVGGLNILTTPALRCGCTITMHGKFDPDATFDAIEADRITLTVLVPAQLEVLVKHPRWATADLSSLRMITTGSTMVFERLIRTVQARGVPLITVWGATETSPIAAGLRAEDAERKVGSTGLAARGVELRIIDAFGEDVKPGASGELLVRGRNVMSGYWQDKGANARSLAAGWFHSGDSGHVDADGYLYIDGRLKDMIISGGENVSPAEVETVLLNCPDIANASVVGRPDPRWGERVVAVVVPQPGAQISTASVLALFDGQLARFKHPKDIIIVDDLPSTALGKVRKDDVRALVERLYAKSS